LTTRRVVADFLRKKTLPIHASEELLDALIDTPLTPCSDATAVYLDSLRGCREKLNESDEQLLGLRYAESLGNRQIADRLKRSEQSVCNSLTRVRRWLLDCITRELARRDRPAEDRS
jgi:DNA-directed RNA polymerase specialized sigma24 family protein